MKRYKSCRHAGPRKNKSCGDCTVVCGLGLGTNGTCRITHELQDCDSYEVKVKAQFQPRPLKVVQVDNLSDLEGRVVGDDDELEVKLLGQGDKQVPDPLPVPLPE